MGRRMSRDEQEYRTLEHSGRLHEVIGSYAIGQRGSDTLDTLARAKALADNIGEWVPSPRTFDRSTWNDILSDLVLRRLGDLRCLDCRHYYRDTGYRAFIGREGVRAPMCPNCGAVLSEPVACTAGIVL
jgi:hypothetical protein